MSNYTKEKNIITINLDGVNGTYKFDVNTAVFYGLKGNPVKTCTHKSAVARVFGRNYNETYTFLASTLYTMFNNSNQTASYQRYRNAIQTADKLDNLKIPFKNWSWSFIEEIGENFKMFTAYLKNLSEEDRENGNIDMREFRNFVKVSKAKERWGENILKLFPEEILSRVLEYNEPYEYTAEEMSVCAYHLVRGKLYEYENRDLRKFIEYIRMCRCMKKEPQKVNNFMREYCETVKEYELRKAEFDNERIRMNYARQSEALSFEYGNFTIVCPTCAQDLIDEGRNMHHCVGGYVNEIINGTDYIVFVRRKDNPEQCYLTCEILPNGVIRQYYLAYDRNISTEEDRAFKTAFQNHLNEKWVR